VHCSFTTANDSDVISTVHPLKRSVYTGYPLFQLMEIVSMKTYLHKNCIMLELALIMGIFFI